MTTAILVVLGVLGYLTVGYLSFRMWLLLAPPKKGTCDSCLGPYIHDIWYVPAIFSSPIYTGDPKGYPITWALTFSLLIWPVLWTASLTVTFSKIMCNTFSRLAHWSYRKLIPDLDKKKLIEPETDSEDLLDKEFSQLEQGK